MRRTRLVLGLLSFPLIISAAPFLLETYQSKDLLVPKGQKCDTAVLELTFSVDTGSYAIFTTGGQARLATLWLKLDGEKLRPKVSCSGSSMTSVPITYSAYLEPGNHTVSLWFECYTIDLIPTDPLCTYSYLQALVFVPDTAVTEEAIEDSGHGQTPEMSQRSLISRGPYVQVNGCTDLIDASGRVIENAVSGDMVYISNLTDGTYFARKGEETVVKIVKVK